MKFDTKETMLSLLEANDLDYFAEEWCVPKMRTMDAIHEMRQAVREFCALCKNTPNLAEKFYSDLQKVKEKILADLIKKHSLLNPESL